jgi:hypothetical protein
MDGSRWLRTTFAAACVVSLAACSSHFLLRMLEIVAPPVPRPPNMLFAPLFIAEWPR